MLLLLPNKSVICKGQTANRSASNREAPLLSIWMALYSADSSKGETTMMLLVGRLRCPQRSPAGSPSGGGDVKVFILGYTPVKLTHCFYFLPVYFCLYGPFNYFRSINSPSNSSVFSLCSSGLISAFSVHST